MTAAEWWQVALVDTESAVRAWRSLKANQRKIVKEAVRKAHQQDSLLAVEFRTMGQRVASVLDDIEWRDLLDSWDDGIPMSEHLELTLIASDHLGRPLEAGEPVPGCSCAKCTGLPEDHAARIPAWKRRLEEKRRGEGDEGERERRAAWQRKVWAARAVPILQVVHQLGLGPPEGRGKEVRVCCPFHDDEHPSLRLNPRTNLWYCDPCGEGGDAIGLYMRARGVGFRDAVNELTGG